MTNSQKVVLAIISTVAVLFAVTLAIILSNSSSNAPKGKLTVCGNDGHCVQTDYVSLNGACVITDTTPSSSALTATSKLFCGTFSVIRN